MEQEKKKINRYLLFRLILVLSIIIILYFPLLLFPRRINFGPIYRFAMRLFFWASKIRVNNLSEHDFNRNNPTIYACNHKSYADGVIFAWNIKGPFTFSMSQHVLDKIPPFKIIGWKLGFIGVDKRNYISYAKTFEKIKKITGKGYSVIYFPEGYYTLDRPVGKFKKGIARIAKNTDVTVTPVAIYGVEQDFVHRKKLEWKEAYVKCGHPIRYSDFNDSGKFTIELEDRIEELYLEIDESLNGPIGLVDHFAN